MGQRIYSTTETEPHGVLKNQNTLKSFKPLLIPAVALKTIGRWRPLSRDHISDPRSTSDALISKTLLVSPETMEISTSLNIFWRHKLFTNYGWREWNKEEGFCNGGRIFRKRFPERRLIQRQSYYYVHCILLFYITKWLFSSSTLGNDHQFIAPLRLKSI